MKLLDRIVRGATIASITLAPLGCSTLHNDSPIPNYNPKAHQAYVRGAIFGWYDNYVNSKASNETKQEVSQRLEKYSDKTRQFILDYTPITKLENLEDREYNFLNELEDTLDSYEEYQKTSCTNWCFCFGIALSLFSNKNLTIRYYLP